jgi:hypothetical protein
MSTLTRLHGFLTSQPTAVPPVQHTCNVGTGWTAGEHLGMVAHHYVSYAVRFGRRRGIRDILDFPKKNKIVDTKRKVRYLEPNTDYMR